MRSLVFYTGIPQDDHKALQRLQGASMLLLPQLPKLQHLTINDDYGFMTPERHLHVMECLPQLKSLSLSVSSDGTWSPATLDPLTHLRSLTRLDLCISQMIGSLEISPLLTCLTQLHDLRLDCSWKDLCEISPDHLMSTVSKLTTLETLTLVGLVDCVPPQLGALAQLTQFNLRELGSNSPEFAIPPSFSLCTNLQHLSFSYCGNASNEGWQHACSLLSLLPCMKDLAISELGLSGVHPSSWSLPSELTSLALDYCGMSTVPAAICDLTNLQQLSILDSDEARVELTALPKGPYLYNLQRLEINRPKLGAGPEALAHAVNLQFLEVNCKQDTNPLWIPTTLRRLVPECRKILYTLNDIYDI